MVLGILETFHDFVQPFVYFPKKTIINFLIKNYSNFLWTVVSCKSYLFLKRKWRLVSF